jgi:hypothetical protein
MSALPTRTVALEYQGDSGFVYPEETRYTFDVVTSEVPTHSVFYKTLRVLSATIAIGFIGLLAWGFIAGGPVHWAVSVVGCLGSIGLAGAIWLSKPYLHRHSIK